MNKLVDGSCTSAASQLDLSLWGTLALRASLMILRRITFGNGDRCLKVSIDSSFVVIRVSKRRRSSSTQARETECMGEAGFGFTGTTRLKTKPLPADASSFLEQFGNGFQP